MVNGPGTVILIGLSVIARRCATSRTCTGRVRLISPITRGTIWRVLVAALDLGGVVDVDAVERGREAVEVALAPDLAVRHDVEAGRLLLAHRLVRRVVLRLLEIRLGSRARSC